MTDSSLITLLLLGHPEPDIGYRIVVPDRPDNEADGFNVIALDDDRNLPVVLADARPHVIFSFGSPDAYPTLMAMPLDIRRRWLHYEKPPTPVELARAALAVYVDVATNDGFPNTPLG